MKSIQVYTNWDLASAVRLISARLLRLMHINCGGLRFYFVSKSNTLEVKAFLPESVVK